MFLFVFGIIYVCSRSTDCWHNNWIIFHYFSTKLCRNILLDQGSQFVYFSLICQKMAQTLVIFVLYYGSVRFREHLKFWNNYIQNHHWNVLIPKLFFCLTNYVGLVYFLNLLINVKSENFVYAISNIIQGRPRKGIELEVTLLVIWSVHLII